MAENINWSATVVVSSGPRLSVSDSLQVDAYDKLAVTLDAQAEDVEVDLQPSAAAMVRFLMIKATPSDEKVTYSVEGSNKKLALDAPHFMVGKGAISLFGADPTKLKLSNGTESSVKVEVIVGRSATS